MNTIYIQKKPQENNYVFMHVQHLKQLYIYESIVLLLFHVLVHGFTFEIVKSGIL